MVVHPSVPAKTVTEFIAYAKANPGKINIASGPIGGASHVSGELFKLMTGAHMLLVSYRGTAPAVTDLLGGQVQVMFPTAVSSIGYIRSGRLRALAVSAATRSDALPDPPRSASSSRALRRASGPASAHRRPRRPRSSTSSTRRSTLASPIPRSRRGLPTWVATCSCSRPRTSESTSRTKRRSGAMSSGPSTSRRTEADPLSSRYSINSVRRMAGVVDFTWLGSS
jgi:hypothetical protein